MEDVYDILNYLPIDDLEVHDYVGPLLNSALITYEKEQYQFAYFALHLVFMTAIYGFVWKISQFHKEKYEDSLLFARPYNGTSVDFKNVQSLFAYSKMPEKDIFEFLSLVGLDNSFIKSVKRLIDTRNEMAHASGQIRIATSESFDRAIKELLSILGNIQKKLNNTIKNWYKEELNKIAKNGIDTEFEDAQDYIKSVFVDRLSFSRYDLQTCSECGVSKFKDRKHFDFSDAELEQLQSFHSTLKNLYEHQYANY